MKKLLYIAPVLVLLCSCSNEINQVAETTQENRIISFDAYLAGQTRTAAEEVSELTEPFQVFAFEDYSKEIEEDIEDVFNKVFYERYKLEEGKVEAQDSDHEWSDNQMSFYAFYNVNVTDTFQSKALAIRVYDGSQDMLVASAGPMSKQNSVNLSFSHILTEVQAKISCDATLNGKCYLSSITLTGAEEGTYVPSTGEWVSSEREEQDGTTGTAGPQPKEYTLFAATVSRNRIPVFSEPQTVEEKDEAGEVSVFMNSALMVIPGKYSIKVVYEDEYGTTSKTIEASDVNLDYQGSRVILNIKIADNRILFESPTVEGWGDSNDITVD